MFNVAPWYPLAVPQGPQVLQMRPVLRSRMALLPRPAVQPRPAAYGGLVFPAFGPAGGPVFGSLNPFQSGSAVIDPAELFFRAGNPIGGPSEGFRGVRASSFPSYASVVGPGAPLSGNGLGIAGVHIGLQPGWEGRPFRP